MARLRAGDEQAYEQLTRTQMGQMLAVARRILRNDEDAQDAVQQAFLAAFRALPAFGGQSRLSTWLHRIVVNEALMMIRKRGRRPEGSIEDLLPRFQDDGHHVEQFRDWSDSVEVAMGRREVRRMVRKAVDQLPESYRIVVILRDIESLDTAETARLLGVTPSAVKTRLHRARQALTKMLTPVFVPRGGVPTP